MPTPNRSKRSPRTWRRSQLNDVQWKYEIGKSPVGTTDAQGNRVLSEEDFE